jgi:hypothetical protein
MKYRILLLITLAALFWNVAAGQALDLDDFTHCVAWDAGSYMCGDVNCSTLTTCQLASGVYSVETTIDIGRSGLTIEGTVDDSGDAVLQRSSSLGGSPIMTIDNEGYTVTVEWLTFDGNRNNTTLCGSGTWADLDLQYAGESGPGRQDHFSSAISYESAGLI